MVGYTQRPQIWMHERRPGCSTAFSLCMPRQPEAKFFGRVGVAIRSPRRIDTHPLLRALRNSSQTPIHPLSVPNGARSFWVKEPLDAARFIPPAPDDTEPDALQ